jgi:4-amino-4-deoxy-L-arabinose transferase-like glycosyltransferase
VKPVPRRRAYVVVAAVAALPRLAALLYERGHILQAFTDKSDVFARTFASSGTFGFLPGHASAYTQPLYGFFLAPLYWAFGRHWEVVGLAQVAVAIGTALIVFEIGQRVVSGWGGLVAALLTTLHPYLIWHDVHLNREILDQLVAAAVVLLTLAVVERPRMLLAALLGVTLGLAILGNVRLALLPLLLVAFVLWRTGVSRRAIVLGAVTLVLTGVTVAPWAIRNAASVGCLAITTDARALWKANNPDTYRVLTHGGWIDAVPNVAGAPPTPNDAYERYLTTGKLVPTNECAQLDYYSHKTHAFWLHHFGSKVKLALLSGQMLWQPSVVETGGRPGAGTWLDTLRTSSEPLYVAPLYLLAIAGLFFVPRAFAVLVVLIAAYQTAVAMIFVGVTRYRVPWDFLLCVLASAAILELARRVRELCDARVVGRPHLER